MIHKWHWQILRHLSDLFIHVLITLHVPPKSLITNRQQHSSTCGPMSELHCITTTKHIPIPQYICLFYEDPHKFILTHLKIILLTGTRKLFTFPNPITLALAIVFLACLSLSDRYWDVYRLHPSFYTTQ